MESEREAKTIIFSWYSQIEYADAPCETNLSKYSLYFYIYDNLQVYDLYTGTVVLLLLFLTIESMNFSEFV